MPYLYSSGIQQGHIFKHAYWKGLIKGLRLEQYANYLIEYKDVDKQIYRSTTQQIQELLDKDPHNKNIWETLLSIHHNQENKEEMLKTSRAMIVEFEDCEAFDLIIIHSNDAEEKEEVLTRQKKCINHNTDQRIIHNYLMEMVRMDRETEAEQIIDLQWNNIPNIASIIIKCRRKKFEEAYKYSQRYKIKEMNNDSFFHYWTGIACYETSRFDEAKIHLEKYSLLRGGEDLEPKAEDLLSYLRAMK